MCREAKAILNLVSVTVDEYKYEPPSASKWGEKAWSNYKLTLGQFH